jgi:hypothetical protein
MDGGSNEKAMAASIKQIVKTTSRRKARGGVAFSVGRLGARMKAVGVGEERRERHRSRKRSRLFKSGVKQ